MRVKGIRWVGVCAEDFDRSAAFYRDVLGLEVRGGVAPVTTDPAARCVELGAADGDFLELFSGNLAERELYKGPVVGFLVDDVRAARAEMEAKGAEFLGPVGRGGKWEWAYFRSPEGHVYELLAEVK